MNWQEISISVTVITGAIAFISKTLFSKFIDAGIEKYKVALNKDIELYKSNLVMINTEHQIRYSKLYEQRGKKIKKLYQLIYELENKLKFLTSAFQGSEWTTDTERPDAVRNHLFILEKTFELNRIYFTDELCKRIANIISQSVQISNDFKSAKHMQEYSYQDATNAWLKAENSVQTDIKQARLGLINEFHQLIGVK